MTSSGLYINRGMENGEDKREQWPHNAWTCFYETDQNVPFILPHLGQRCQSMGPVIIPLGFSVFMQYHYENWPMQYTEIF